MPQLACPGMLGVMEKMPGEEEAAERLKDDVSARTRPGTGRRR